jgi:hypothetical protein
MYGLCIPENNIKVKILNKEVNIKAQTFHAYESIYLEDFKKKYGDYPELNDNCDPIYKTKQIRDKKLDF